MAARSKKNPHGFTLIELLVVIAIIGFLSAIGLAVFSTAQQKARDGQRKSDIAGISKVLEIHKTDTGGYQSLQGTWFESAQIPSDPKGNMYCGCSYGASDSVTDLTGGKIWDGKTCPAINVSGCPSAWVEVNASNAWPTDTTSNWRICAIMENDSSIFCKHNVQ